MRGHAAKRFAVLSCAVFAKSDCLELSHADACRGPRLQESGTSITMSTTCKSLTLEPCNPNSALTLVYIVLTY